MNVEVVLVLVEFAAAVELTLCDNVEVKLVVVAVTV